jgi:hypothetical protein
VTVALASCSRDRKMNAHLATTPALSPTTNPRACLWDAKSPDRAATNCNPCWQAAAYRLLAGVVVAQEYVAE